MKKTSLENNKKIKKIKKNNKRCEHPFEFEVNFTVENDLSTIDRTTFGYHTGEDEYSPSDYPPPPPGLGLDVLIKNPLDAEKFHTKVLFGQPDNETDIDMFDIRLKHGTDDEVLPTKISWNIEEYGNNFSACRLYEWNQATYDTLITAGLTEEAATAAATGDFDVDMLTQNELLMDNASATANVSFVQSFRLAFTPKESEQPPVSVGRIEMSFALDYFGGINSGDFNQEASAHLDLNDTDVSTNVISTLDGSNLTLLNQNNTEVPSVVTYNYVPSSLDGVSFTFR